MIISAVGVVVGCLGFVFLKFHYNNDNAGYCALFSGFMAALVLSLHIKFAIYWKPNVNVQELPSTVQETYGLRPNTFMSLHETIISLAGMVFGLFWTVTFFSYAYNTEGPVIPSISELPHSHYTVSFFSFLTFLWSLMVLVTDNYLLYIIQLDMEERRPLLRA